MSTPLRLRTWGYPACAGIDPPWPILTCGPLRLPRMRGDRPSGMVVGLRRTMATPHARGSTVHSRRRAHRHSGYPACAGIDRRHLASRYAQPGLPRMRGDRPRQTEFTLISAGLPRMRGDRPLIRLPTPFGLGATPHARGSTRGDMGLGRGVAGYPACAGIDPRGLQLRHIYLRLPRMRGDRPLPGRLCALWPQATPHARGSTSTEKPDYSHHAGYPACAGIDLFRAMANSSGSRLPRMRGDRPQLRDATAYVGRATPHARGSTSPGASIPRAKAGYPACAGIDRDQSVICPFGEGLPRMRGDRPHREEEHPMGYTATPHARGST